MANPANGFLHFSAFLAISWLGGCAFQNPGPLIEVQELLPGPLEAAQRRNYGVYEGAPRNSQELLDQIFADDGIDPGAEGSLLLKNLARSERPLNLYASASLVTETYTDKQQAKDRSRYELALDRLKTSPTFSEIYDKQLKRLMRLPRSRVNFNNRGLNYSGTWDRGIFGKATLGIVLNLDLNTEINILTTRGVTLAIPERIVAHELLDALQEVAGKGDSALFAADDGIMALNTVLLVNRVMRELVQASVLSPVEGAARIRYWR